MDKKEFRIKEAINFGFGKTKQNFWVLAAVTATIIIVEWAPGFIDSATNQPQNSILSAIMGIVFFGLRLILDLGIIGIVLNILDGKKTKYVDLFSKYEFFVNYLIGTVLYALMMFLGFVLLIVPGIIVAVRFPFFGYFIVEKKMGPIEALKSSWEATKGNSVKLYLFGFLNAIINIGGLLALVVGILIAFPTTQIAQGYVYKKLSGASKKLEASKD